MSEARIAYSEIETTVADGVYVAPSSVDGAGLGLYSGMAFGQGRTITEYTGKRVDSDFDVARLEVQTHVAYSGTRQLGNPFWVDGDRTPQVGRGGGSFANHSKSPNAEIVVQNDKIVLRALKPISPGDEIFVDYGSALELAFGAKRKELSRNVNGQQSITSVRVGEPQKFRELHEFGFTLLTHDVHGFDLPTKEDVEEQTKAWELIFNEEEGAAVEGAPMASHGQVGRRVRKERQESSRRERPQLALHVAEEGRYARRGQEGDGHARAAGRRRQGAEGRAESARGRHDASSSSRTPLV